MDFQALKKLQLSSQQGLRAQKAAKLIEQGFALLARAHQENFQDKQQIRKAAALLLEAVDYQLDDVRPHLGLAYIFALLEKYAAALEFLEAVLQMEPENILIQGFQAHLQAELEDLSPTALVSPESEAELDYDTLYDQTEQLLFAQIHSVGQVQIPNPSSQPQILEDLKEQMHRVLEIQTQIQHKLQILDREFDITPLSKLAQSLNIVFQRFKGVYRQSKQLQHVQSDISLTREQSQKLYSKLKGQGYLSPEYDQTLEQLLDRCDRIADRLDEFEHSQIAIVDLMPFYENLIQEVQNIQEAMDELPRQPLEAPENNLLKKGA